MKMSVAGALTGKHVDLPDSHDSDGYMRPVTRSQTRSRPSLKRKGPSEARTKAGRPTKLARTSSASSDASTKPKREPIIGIPTDVPRSMLLTFRVDSSPFQMYDGERRTTVDAVSRSSSPPRFPAMASQPMFGHSWQVSLADPSQPAADAPSHQVSPCVSPHPAVYPRVPAGDSFAMAIHPHAASAPSVPDGGPVLRTHRIREHGDENRSPEGVAMEVPPDDLSAVLKVNNVSDGRPVAPLCPSTVSSPNRPSVVIEPVDPLSYTSAYMSVPSTALPSLPSTATSSVAVKDADRVEVTIVDTTPSYYPPGQGPHASHQMHPEYMHFVPPPFCPSFMPPQPHLSSNASYSAGRSSPSASYASLHPTDLSYHPSFYPAAPFTPAHALDLHTPFPHSSDVPAPVPSPSTMYGHSGVLPHSLPPHPTPWCTMFDSLKGSNRRLGGTSKQSRKSRTVASSSTSSRHPCPTPPTPPVEQGASKRPPVEVHPCPLCPRTFNLPNSLAIHLKWHWGASGLDWKKGSSGLPAVSVVSLTRWLFSGINLQGKGLQKAFEDAARRREEAEKLRLDLEQAFRGEPEPDCATTSSAIEEGSPVPSPLSEEHDVPFHSAYAFDMPIIAQTSLSSIFDFSFGGVNPDTFDSSTSASSSQMPLHASSSSSPTLPSSSAAASVTGSASSAYGSVPLTPELMSADSASGSSNAASVGYGSPTWSYDLFGGEPNDVDVDLHGGDGGSGMNMMDDLFGDPLDLGAGLNIGGGDVVGVGLDFGGGGSGGEMEMGIAESSESSPGANESVRTALSS